MNKTEYKVITGVGLQEITSNVNKEIDKGWTPLGGVSTSIILKNEHEGTLQKLFYSQAMINHK